MKPYAVVRGDISKNNLVLFQHLRMLAEKLPIMEDDEVFSCHSLCEAFTQVFPTVIRKSGYFGDMCEHSWLTPKNQKTVVMDMYPVAGGCPFIVFVGSPILPWSKLYNVSALELDERVIARQAKKVMPFLT